jgi:catechol 2,3-dioxygenase-like lactoylglutathione lyase family enzyme
MNLTHSKIIGFIPSANLDASASFYTNKLGLELVGSDDYALEYLVNNTTLRITKVADLINANYTVLGWEVKDIISAVEELQENGVELVFYEGMSQNENGICSFPNGGKVAWFKDPDDNILSITQRQNA